MVAKKDAEMTEREDGREGGRTGFQGAAGSRSTQTDAVEQRWLEKKERGQCVCVCARACACVLFGGVGGWRGLNCKHHTTFAAAANHPCND